jgi:hypothetical protein
MRILNEQFLKEDYDSIYINRQTELDSLQERLLNQDLPLVIITGGPGMGKTALAKMFSQKYRDFFTGGIYPFLNAPFISLLEMSLNTIPFTMEPVLIVVDEVHNLNLSLLDEEMVKIRDKLPRAKFIAISRMDFRPQQKYETIHLKKFHYEQLNELIQNYKLPVPFGYKCIKSLIQSFEGNPAVAKMMLDNIKKGIYTPG